MRSFAQDYNTESSSVPAMLIHRCRSLTEDLGFLSLLDVSTSAHESTSMLRANIVREIQAMPFQEQFEMLEYLASSLRRQSQAQAASGATSGSLADAAAALRSDYQNDPELTAFTSLDGEEFHAAR